ncbi:class I SAM-dependent methyltransferase [Aeromicrobium terrae]|uniref:Class I SAM-dependent methyltransferase n=1 Tax=Aeromicrobium terrae TaxID=2498846 RepID=A0A5C8NML1_9ACTN|nr:class I SAM-dependent methyltransferase [Aeromicrobium terrae]TXL62320.1 class I SAM-dependent methyltransferase [Aeromicrobium terrae]
MPDERALIILRSLEDLAGNLGDGPETDVTLVSDDGGVDAAHAPYARVVVVASGDSPAELRSLVDLAASLGPGDVHVTAVSVADADAESWATAFVGFEVVETEEEFRSAVLKPTDDAQMSAGPFLHGWLSAIEAPSPEAPVSPAPSPAPPPPAVASVPRAGRAQRLRAALFMRRKLVAAAVVVALLAFALSIGLVALLDEYYLATLSTGLAMLVAVGILRSEQQSRRLLARDRERAAQMTALSKSLGPAQMEQLRRAVSANELATNEVIHRLKLMRDGFVDPTKPGLLRQITRESQSTFEQVQATINLFTLADVKAPVPPMRGWAVSPDALNILVQEMLVVRPSVVVECGSGVSTLFLALTAKQVGLDVRIVALDHDAEYAGKTNRMLALHGVDDIAMARFAAIEPVSTDDGERPWYALSAIEDLTDIGLLFIDGPPKATAPLARYPALPQLWDRLAPDSSIVLDDTNRQDEQEIIERWTASHQELSIEEFSTEKGMHVLRRSAPH